MCANILTGRSVNLKILFFSYISLTQISYLIFLEHLKLETHIHDDHWEGSVSQILYLGFSFCCMQSRIFFFLND